MINDDSIAIKDSILNTAGDDCEKIFSLVRAYGNSQKDSAYDWRTGVHTPLLAAGFFIFGLKNTGNNSR